MYNKNCYHVLGVNSTADFKEIKSAYRSLAKKFHPDKNPGNKTAEEHFKEIQQAYMVLSSLEKRKKYDLKFSHDHLYQKKYTRYNGNAYQYAQQQAKQESQQNGQNGTQDQQPSNQYKTEMYYLVISTVIALLLLYFIISF